MKKCSWCGKEYPDDASFCAIDGYALQPVAGTCPPTLTSAVGERQRTDDADHIKLLAIFHFVVAGLALMGILFLAGHYLLMNSVISNPAIWRSSKNAFPPPKEFFAVFVWVYFILGAFLVTASVLNLLSGVFLLQRRHRVFSLVVAGLNCLHIPFGTVLGIFTIMVLSRGSVRAMYELDRRVK
ncbi:MAG TPA: zinc ribbon domain-containing protein [Verrucomicrobiae bacterium]|nr:zinc ribbon domain-containing protein [Verrucomicrobiae bacterium]